MENFLALPIKKQSAILTAALQAFGQNGYKKASTADVAAGAGISKAMVFHYFGTKKALYLYLCEHCSLCMKTALKASGQAAGGDFFEAVRYVIDIKIAVLKDNPHMLEFLKNMYTEADPEVAEDLHRYHEMVLPFQRQAVIDDAGAAKFKAGIDPMQVMKMLNWMGAGYIDELTGVAGKEHLEKIAGDFHECLGIMKSSFYKEQHLRK